MYLGLSGILSVMNGDTSRILGEVTTLLEEFSGHGDSSGLRERVQALIPVLESIRELGKTLVPKGLQMSARDRLLAYFQAYPLEVIDEKELAVVVGISEWARRVRELRVQFGWRIITGLTAKDMATEGEVDVQDLSLNTLRPTDYVLVDTEQDRTAPHRWNLANDIRKSKEGSRSSILRYLRANVGHPVTGEELRYVAQSSEWARRVRELRTEEGWPISTKMSGNPTLAVGVYMLEADRQTPTHDRHISDRIRREVMRRDEYTCRKCGWNYRLWNPSDPRFLEVHHLIHHASGGTNEAENLVTYCNVCHDEVHKLEKER